MKADDLIAFLIEEAWHCIINVEWSKNSEQALAAHVKRKGKGRPKQQAKGDRKALSVDSEITCFNCGGKGHKKPDCWSKGGCKGDWKLDLAGTSRRSQINILTSN